MSESMGGLTAREVSNAINFIPKQPSTLKLNVGGRVLLTIRREGDVFTADYDPADLDEAARLFVEEVGRHLGLPVRDPTLENRDEDGMPK